MLNAISDRYQKTTGFPAYDFTRAFALAVLSLDGDIELAEANLDVDNLAGVALDTYIKQHRGLTRKYATYATATLRVVSGGGEVLAGALFSTLSGVEFYAISDGTYAQGDTFIVRAYVAGDSGNVGPNTITYMPVTIAGIGAVANDGAASGGYDAETDDEFRDGSNQQAYLPWAMSVPGVGRVRIFPQALGPNTVEVCVVDANMEPAGAALLRQVQELIDSNGNGDGNGESPIGAACTVTSATALEIDVSATVSLAEGQTLAGVTAAVQANLTAYLREIAFDKGGTYVSYTQIASRINATEGVLDHGALKVNNESTNVALTDRQTPVLGTVVLT